MRFAALSLSIHARFPDVTGPESQSLPCEQGLSQRDIPSREPNEAG
jgi:hypothetical protein